MHEYCSNLIRMIVQSIPQICIFFLIGLPIVVCLVICVAAPPSATFSRKGKDFRQTRNETMSQKENSSVQSLDLCSSKRTEETKSRGWIALVLLTPDGELGQRIPSLVHQKGTS